MTQIESTSQNPEPDVVLRVVFEKKRVLRAVPRELMRLLSQRERKENQNTVSKTMRRDLTVTREGEMEVKQLILMSGDGLGRTLMI